jgi:hypothetical protein
MSGAAGLPAAGQARHESQLRWAFGAVLLVRLLYPHFSSPLHHLFSDPQRHWDNGLQFLHPSFMGSSDPFLYQLWLFLLTRLPDSGPLVETLTGVLCAAMPYGWYRALKELVPRGRALQGAILIGLVPGFLGIYAYFMNETLLLTLTGFAFWATFRAHRKRTIGAFVVACLLWLAAGFTRSVALPVGLLCLAAIWVPQPQRLLKALAGAVCLLAFLVPAALHGRENLHFLAPFGNPYLNHIYAISGKREISAELGPQGHYGFGCPSFYNPTFYPFSDWTTARTGVVAITVDTAAGRSGWLREEERVRRERSFPRWRMALEAAAYVGFGQAWPDNDRGTLLGWLTVWTRWLWPPLILLIAAGALRGMFRGIEWLLPVSALGLIGYFVIQDQGIIEARFRKPLDPLLVASAVVLVQRLSRRRSAAAVPGGENR